MSSTTVVVLSGAVSSGKSTLAHKLVEHYGATRISTRELLLSRIRDGSRPDRGELQKIGDRLDRQTGGEWLAEAVSVTVNSLGSNAVVVVDSARILAQIERLRDAFGRRVVHLHLHAPPKVISARYEHRKGGSNLAEMSSYDEVRENPTEAAIDELSKQADVVIDTSRCTPDDVLTRAASHLGLTSRGLNHLVDVIVGTQYGSEGKGHIVSHIAPEYQMLVRVGGPNAGHQVIGANGEVYTHRQLPSGTLACDARLAIGAGAVIDVRVLQEEIAYCGVDVDRLAIDPQAMIISAADVREEKGLVEAIGSTGKGGGAALARRIRHRHRQVKLARDVPALRPYTQRAVIELLEDAYARDHRILLEGTQGTGLSLYHGDYPHVTSRDTTAAGCLAEAGIAPARVRRVIMICRTYPIRVKSPEGSTSGVIGHELGWGDIAKRSGLDRKALERAEKGSVSHRTRRVAEFDWVQLRRSAILNGSTDIALTFVDYLHKENQQARRFDQLTDDTINFIEEIERVGEAPVTLISTRFHPRSIIDRRRW